MSREKSFIICLAGVLVGLILGGVFSGTDAQLNIARAYGCGIGWPPETSYQFCHETRQLWLQFRDGALK